MTDVVNNVVEEQNNEDEVNGFVVKSPVIARQLINKGKGYRVIDIKPDKAVRGRTVFVFEETLEAYKEFERLKARRRRNYTTRTKDEVTEGPAQED